MLRRSGLSASLVKWTAETDPAAVNNGRTAGTGMTAAAVMLVGYMRTCCDSLQDAVCSYQTQSLQLSNESQHEEPPGEVKMFVLLLIHLKTER